MILKHDKVNLKIELTILSITHLIGIKGIFIK